MLLFMNYCKDFPLVDPLLDNTILILIHINQANSFIIKINVNCAKLCGTKILLKKAIIVELFLLCII